MFTGGTCPGSGVVLGLFFAGRVQLLLRLALETESPKAAAGPAPAQAGWACSAGSGAPAGSAGGSLGHPRTTLIALSLLDGTQSPSLTCSPNYLHRMRDDFPPNRSADQHFTVPLLPISPKK